MPLLEKSVTHVLIRHPIAVHHRLALGHEG